MIVFTICFLNNPSLYGYMCFAADLNAFSLLHEMCYTPASPINVLSIQNHLRKPSGSCLWPSTSLTCSSRLTHDRPSQHIPQVTLSLLRKGMWRMNVNGTWLKKKINYKMLPLSAHEFASLEHSHHPRRAFFPNAMQDVVDSSLLCLLKALCG